MDAIQEEILKIYGNKLRVRACGIAVQDDKILLIKHHTIGKGNIFWSPPGGGIQFGEFAEDTLIREFREETNLKIKVRDFLFINEFIAPPLHAIELFFRIEILSGTLQIGSDPEMSPDRQIIQEARFFTLEEIRKLEPVHVHQVLRQVPDIPSLVSLKGYFKNGEINK